VPLCMGDNQRAAADLIESLQAQLADYHHMSELVDGKMEENQRLRRINENLQSQLAASQRREQAAVEDINSMLDNVDSVICCHYCAKSKYGEYCGFDSEGGNGELLHCPGEWRGPQDGKGDNGGAE